MSSPSDESRAPRRLLLKWTLGAAAVLVILAAIGVGLFRIAANLLPRYHVRIQQQVSMQLGAPVKLGRISLRWHGLGPELAVRNVQVLNATTRHPVITVRRLRLDFSPFAIFRGTDARPSRIAAAGLHLTLTQQPDGGFAVIGLSPPTAGGGSMQAMLATAFSLTDAVVHVRLAGNELQTWTFAPVDAEIGGGRSHAVTLSVTMPGALGASRLRVVGTVETPDIDPAQWKWQAHAALGRLQLAPLGRLLPAAAPKPAGVLAFDGTLRGTGSHLTGGSGRLAATQLAAGASRVALFRSRYGIGNVPGYSVTLLEPRIVEQNRIWRPGTVTLARDPSGRLHAAIGHVALAALAPLSGFLPARASAVAARLAAMAPRGSIDNVHFALTPGRVSPDLKAEIRDVTVQAAMGAPGFAHLSADVNLVNGSGTVKVDAPDFTLLMPHLFHHPVRLDRVSGNLAVSLSGAGLRLATSDLSIKGADLSGGLRGEIDIPRGAPVHIKLQAKAAETDLVAARARYLPQGLLPRALDDWLMHGLEGGHITGATLSLDGTARQFPYAHGGGHFLTQFGFSGVTLKPGPQWPPLENLAGQVKFENAAMHATISSGTVQNATIVHASTSIADLFKLHLSVDAEVAGDARDFLAFLRASPAGEKLKDAFGKFHARGPTRTTLTLNLPIMHPARFILHGRLRVAGVVAGYDGVRATFDDLRGSAEYDRNGPLDGELGARVAGTPVRLRLARIDSGSKARVSMSGVFPVGTLKELTNLDLSRYAFGRLPLQVDLTVPLAAANAPVTIDAYSDLRGLGLRLPAPVGKEPGTRVATQAHLKIRGDVLRVTARYANVLNGCSEIDARRMRSEVRGLNIVLGTGACKVPPSGMRISGGWQSLELGPWLAEILKQRNAVKHGGKTPGQLALDLHFGEIRAFSQVFKSESVTGTLAPTRMLLTLGGPNLAGRLSIPRHPTNASPIVAELTRGEFALPQKQGLIVAPPNGTAGAPASKAQPAAASTSRSREPARTAPVPGSAARTTGKSARTPPGRRVTPQDIPPFVIHAAHLEIGSSPLNDVLIKAKRVGDGIVLDPVKVGGGALTLDGAVAWIRPPDRTSEGALRVTGNVNGLGKLLTGLGLGPVITGHGSFSAALAWHEPPAGGGFSDQLLGRVSVDLRDGGISQVNPGAGRILSLLALANIPRYLVFNFSNLFGKGFPFNRIHGDYVIDKGIATTDGLIIDSSVAWIKLTGSIDLPRETIDQKAVIVPNYTGSLPVIGALLGGLPVGAAIYAVTKIFGGAIAQATSLQYSVTGPLAKPTVKSLAGTPAPKPGTTPAASRQRQTPAAEGGR